MPRMTVHMLGIMYFDLPKAGPATVLMPDGTTGTEPHIPPHYTSLFVETARCQSYANWVPIEREVPVLTIREQTVMVPVLEFRVPSFSDIVFPPDKTVPNVDVKTLRQGLVHMSDVDPSFTPDLLNAQKGAIARVTISSGTLEAFTFNRNVNTVRWTIRTDNAPLTITAGQGTVVLKPQPDSEFGAEVVLTNSHDVLKDLVPGANLTRMNGGAHGSNGNAATSTHIHHFNLFGKIDLNHGTPRFPAYRSNARYGSSLMACLEDAAYDSSCTPPCCR
jgi:hypothetical protein